MSSGHRQAWTWFDGEIHPVDAPVVPSDDAALTSGHGIFETMRVVRGAPFAMTRHLRRLRASGAIAEVTVPWNDTQLVAASDDLLRNTPPIGPGLFGRLRIHVSAGARSPLLLLAHVPEWGPDAALVTVDRAIHAADPLRAAKSSNRLGETLALADAARLGADEAVRFSLDGALSECSTSNVFVVLDGTLATPGAGTGCLGGVTRELVMEMVEVVERDDLTADDLARASEVFITSSTRGVQPARTVDGRQLDAPGPTTDRVMRSYSALVAATVDP